MLTLFPQAQTLKPLGLESRRYIGNKAKLTEWITQTLIAQTKNCHSFLDLFAGTASVAKACFPYFEKIIVNDILYSNYTIYKAFFEATPWDSVKIEKVLQQYSALNPDDLPDNYFSDNFGGKFFDHKNAKLIGYIREDLEQQKATFTQKEFCLLLATLIYNADKIANTVGHFDAYIKKPIKYQPLSFRLIEECTFKNIEIYRENANTLATKVKADVAYLDPPYNSRQYNRFYHIYENLTQWNKPELFGVALKPKPENNSLYCTTKAKSAFEQLVQRLDSKFIAVSYNNTYHAKSTSSENKIKLTEIMDILTQKGETRIFECAHKFFNTGKTEFNDHKELLFVCRVNPT